MIPIFGVTNDDPEVVLSWMKKNNLEDLTVLCALNSKFGKDYGLYIANYKGQLQRAAIGIVKPKIVHAEYVWNQGGPFPNFGNAITEVNTASSRK